MRIPTYLCCSALIFGAPQAIAGNVSGLVTDENGQPLEKVLMCLQRADQPGSCVKTRATNKKGSYSFKGLEAGTEYRVSVSAGTDLATRKANPFPNYVWAPTRHDVALNRRNENAGERNFSGSFNFSNYQQALQLTSADFPLLVNYAGHRYVYLKLYTKNADESENLIYLGQVNDSETLAIDISVTLSTDVLFYEVYSLDDPEPQDSQISLSS